MSKSEDRQAFIYMYDKYQIHIKINSIRREILNKVIYFSLTQHNETLE